MYKIRTLWIALVILFFALIDATSLNYIEIWGVKPDPLLIVVLFFALYGGLGTGVVTGFFSGLVKDIFSGGIFGVNLLFFIGAGAFVGYNFSKFYREKFSIQLVLTLLVSICYTFFSYYFTKFVKDIKDIPFVDVGAFKLFITVVIPFSLYTAILAPVLFFALRKIFRLKY